MPRRRKLLLFTTTSVLVIGVLAISIISSSSSASAAVPAPPSVYVFFTKLSKVGETCPAVYNISLPSQGGFEGNVSLTVVNSPNTVSVKFNPDTVFIPDLGSANTIMTIMGSPDTPIGNLTLTVKLLPPSTRISGNNSNVTVPVGPCIGSPNVKNITTTTTTTTTVASTLTVTNVSTITSVSTTFTSTTTATVRVSDPSTYAWAISATVS